jgi:hypothetical protein
VGRSGKLSLRSVLAEGLAAYRSHLGLLLVAAILVFLPVGVIEAATESLQELDLDDAGTAAIAAAIGGGLMYAATATLGDVFFTGVVAAVVAETRGGVRRELGDVVRHLPFGRLVAVDLLFTLVVAAGLVALVIPGLLAFAWFALAAPVVKIEGGGVANAFRRSRQLVVGNTGRVLVLLLPVIVIGDALAELLQETVGETLGHGFGIDVAGAVLAEALTAPFFALAAVVTAHQLIALHR